MIRFAADSHPPYRTIGADGSITGIDKDFQDAFARVLGVRIETGVVDGLPAATAGMLAGEFEVFNGPVKATREREKQFDTIAAGMTQAAAIDVTSQQQDLDYVTQTQEQGASTDFLAMLVAKDSGLGPVMLEAFHQLFDDGMYADIITRYKLDEVAVAVPVYDINSVSAEGDGTGTGAAPTTKAAGPG